MHKAFVLFSGGLDSTTCLYKALFDNKPPDISDAHLWKVIDQEVTKDFSVDWVEAVSVDYGQRHIKETEYAKKTCEKLGIKHTILDLKGILGGVMLTDKSIEIPDVTYDQISGVSPTYVPFRNGTMLSMITAHAQKWVNEGPTNEALIYFGAHSEDAHNWAYPDCTPEFIGAMATAIFIGSYMKIRLVTPLMWLNKTEVVKLGDDYGVPFQDTWSCYKGEELHCGQCPTCYSRAEAFKNASVPDPTEYARHPFWSKAPF